MSVIVTVTVCMVVAVIVGRVGTGMRCMVVRVIVSVPMVVVVAVLMAVLVRVFKRVQLIVECVVDGLERYRVEQQQQARRHSRTRGGRFDDFGGRTVP
jgi:hypothetical protein